MLRRGLLAGASRIGELQLGFNELRGIASISSRTAAAAAPSCGFASAPLLARALPCQLQAHLLPLRPPTSVPSAGQTAWQEAAARGYATASTKMPRAGYKAPVEMQRPMQMRLSMVSANLLAEPYRGVPPNLPLTAYFTPSGWKEVWRRFVGHAKSLFTVARAKKFIPGFSRTSIKQESLEIYKDVCRLLAEGDKTELRHLVTPAVFSDMKRQLKQREDGGWARVQWDLVREPAVHELNTVHARLIMMDPKDDTTGFAQLTVRIPSQQRFAAYDRQGRLVAGDPERAIEVEDFWVFEHSLKKSPANRWRLAGRLAIQPAAAEPMLPAGAASEPLQPQQKAAGSQKQRVATAEAAAATATAAAAGGTEPPRAGNLREQQRVSRQQQWGEQRAGKRKAAAARGRR
ncbi:putative 39S ribosomal protein L45 [Chlorella vulgaris]